jgi:hypothetical protein
MCQARLVLCLLNYPFQKDGSCILSAQLSLHCHNWIGKEGEIWRGWRGGIGEKDGDAIGSGSDNKRSGLAGGREGSDHCLIR